MFFSNINILVTIVAAVAGIVVGFVWHAPWAFGKMWIHEKKVSNPAWEGKMKKSMTSSYSMISVSTIITAFVFAALFSSLIITSISGIFLIAISLWLGFMVPMKLTDYLFGGESFKFFLMTVGHSLVEVVVIALIIGLFS